MQINFDGTSGPSGKLLPIGVLPPLPLPVTIAACAPGSQPTTSLDDCVECSDGTFNLDGGACLPCPDGAPACLLPACPACSANSQSSLLLLVPAVACCQRLPSLLFSLRPLLPLLLLQAPTAQAAARSSPSPTTGAPPTPLWPSTPACCRACAWRARPPATRRAPRGSRARSATSACLATSSSAAAASECWSHPAGWARLRFTCAEQRSMLARFCNADAVMLPRCATLCHAVVAAPALEPSPRPCLR